MNIARLEPLSFNTIYNVLTNTHISDAQKAQFIRRNSIEIKKIVESKITSDEFKGIMSHRPLIRFKPLKNSYTKWGDKIILAKSLGIKPREVPEYIHNVSEAIKSGDISKHSKEEMETLKTYAYRHGSKDELLNFLDYELSQAGDILGILYRTLSYNTGGAADYFVRPIHRMNNKTLVSLYRIVDKNLTNAKNTGNITEEDHERTAEWALVRILKIQSNSKLINAIKLRDKLLT